MCRQKPQGVATWNTLPKLTSNQKDEVCQNILLDMLLSHLIQQPVYDTNLQHSQKQASAPVWTAHGQAKLLGCLTFSCCQVMLILPVHLASSHKAALSLSQLSSASGIVQWCTPGIHLRSE